MHICRCIFKAQSYKEVKNQVLMLSIVCYLGEEAKVEQA